MMLVSGLLAALVAAFPLESSAARQSADRGFSRIDTNRDGFITRTEAEAFLVSAPPDRRNPDAWIFFFDNNRDGRVSREEYLARMATIGSQRPRAPG